MADRPKERDAATPSRVSSTRANPSGSAKPKPAAKATTAGTVTAASKKRKVGWAQQTIGSDRQSRMKYVEACADALAQAMAGSDSEAKRIRAAVSVGRRTRGSPLCPIAKLRTVGGCTGFVSLKGSGSDVGGGGGGGGVGETTRRARVSALAGTSQHTRESGDNGRSSDELAQATGHPPLDAIASVSSFEFAVATPGTTIACGLCGRQIDAASELKFAFHSVGWVRPWIACCEVCVGKAHEGG